MDTVYYLILAFLAFQFIKATFFTDRSPIPETSGNVHKITSLAELRALLAATTYVAVDCYADWCPPCRAIAPVFSQLADSHAVKGQLAFAKVNVDHVKDVAAELGVTAMPTFVFFRKGSPGVEVGALASRSTVVASREGLVERIRGADKVAIETVVKALAAEVGNAVEKE
ncbi:hypothetical protein ANO14919_136010 [Xylariales sp. No.14919]|nr:hypothetical protein ANO14919_136010 [Xylariales sp. No.14919]